MHRCTYKWVFQLTQAVQTQLAAGNPCMWKADLRYLQISDCAVVNIPNPCAVQGQLYLLQDVISSGSFVFPKFATLGLWPKILEAMDVACLPTSSYFS